MQWTERRERFRAVLEGKDCVHPASVYDPVSARIAEDLGFELGMFAGSIASLTVLGAPDLTLITLTEFADLAQRICRAGSPPAQLANIASAQLMQQVSRDADYARWSRDFLA